MAASSAFMIAEESGSRSRDYKGSEFGEPGHIGSTPRPHRRGGRGLSEPKKSSPTIRNPRQFELTLEDLRRRAGIGRGNRHLGGMASIDADRFRLSSPLYAPNRCFPIASVSPSSMLPPSTTSQ